MVENTLLELSKTFAPQEYQEMGVVVLFLFS